MATKKILTKDLNIDESQQIFNESTKKIEDQKNPTKPLEKQHDEIEQQPIENVQPTSNEQTVVANNQKISIFELIKPLSTGTKVFYYFLLIISFGFITKMIRDRIEDNTENEIKTSSNIPFNLTIFINALGGKNNILETTATLSSVKITLNNIDLVNQQQIKEISKRGILVSENKITIIFGNYSETLKSLLDAEIKK